MRDVQASIRKTNAKMISILNKAGLHRKANILRKENKLLRRDNVSVFELYRLESEEGYRDSKA